jgi:outer membrane biosynthesis protein TonB
LDSIAASEGVVQEDAPKEQEVKETPEEPVKEVVKEEPTKEEPVKEVVKEEPAKEEPVKGAEPAKEEPKVVKKESVPVKGGASERPGGGTNRTGGAVLGPSIEGSLTRKVGAAIATHIQKMGPAGSKIKMQEVKACRDAIIEGIREELHKARQEIIQAIRAK